MGSQRTGNISTSGLQLHGQHLRDRSELYKQAMRLSQKRFLPNKHDLSTLVQTLPALSRDEFILVVSSLEDRLHQPSVTPAASSTSWLYERRGLAATQHTGKRLGQHGRGSTGNTESILNHKVLTSVPVSVTLKDMQK